MVGYSENRDNEKRHLWCIFGSNAVDRGFESYRVKPNTIVGIRYFFARHAVLRSESKDGMARNQDNVSE